MHKTKKLALQSRLKREATGEYQLVMHKTKKPALQQLAVNPACGGTVPIELPGKRNNCIKTAEEIASNFSDGAFLKAPQPTGNKSTPCQRA